MLRFLSVVGVSVAAMFAWLNTNEPPIDSQREITPAYRPTPAVGQPQPAQAPAEKAAPVRAQKEVPASQPVTFPATTSPYLDAGSVGPEKPAVDSGKPAPKAELYTEPAREPVSTKPPVKAGRTDGCRCENCTCDPCVCKVGQASSDKHPYWFNTQNNQLIKGYMLTEEEAAKKNAILKKLAPNARQAAAAASPPVLPFPNPVKPTGNCWSCGQVQTGYPYNCANCGAYLPVKLPQQQPVQQQPATTFYRAPMQGNCANGQCGYGWSYGRRGRR